MNKISTHDEEYDVRQYQLMLERIQDYQNDSIKLSQLVNDLDALQSALQHPTAAWLNDFEPAWGVLEDVYSIMLDEGRQHLDEYDRKLIAGALAKLKSAIQTQVAAARLSP